MLSVCLQKYMVYFLLLLWQLIVLVGFMTETLNAADAAAYSDRFMQLCTTAVGQANNLKQYLLLMYKLLVDMLFLFLFFSACTYTNETSPCVCVL